MLVVRAHKRTLGITGSPNLAPGLLGPAGLKAGALLLLVDLFFTSPLSLPNTADLEKAVS